MPSPDEIEAPPKPQAHERLLRGRGGEASVLQAQSASSDLPEGRDLDTPLGGIIRDMIRRDGPMTLARYMTLCLSHPDYGYYMTRDPLGRGGDFTTAPEISQMFGEVIGAWLADAWIKLGRPARVAVVECGPGRGTLMADALRATRSIPGFHDAVTLYLMEISPVLKAVQQDNLKQYVPVWCDGLEVLADLPDDCPVLLIGNEFLDALPIHQLVRVGAGWSERSVALHDNDTLCFVDVPVAEALVKLIPEQLMDSGEGAIVEVSPAIHKFLDGLCFILKKQRGTALFVDYGHARSGCGDTLQALLSHRFESPLRKPGQCDLTAHVDFENLVHVSTGLGLHATNIVTQGQFLKTIGIEMRALRLMQGATEAQAHDIRIALHRLIAPEAMGTLFKVVALCHDDMIEPAGFA